MRKVTVLVTLIILSQFSFSYALNTETHKAINEYIANNSLNSFSLDSYLKSQLGLQSGLDEKFNSLEVWKWLRDGGEYEDIPYWFTPYVRSVNHFHNPLNDQGYNGFWGTGIMSGMSSTQWALLPQNTQSTFCLLGCYSWYDVRNYYYQALTSVDKTTRGNYFAQTFRGVGQLMHLIEDVSVPSHTKNDGHLLYNYEDYSDAYINKNGVPMPTSAAFYSGTINNIASFIDTDQYSNTNLNPNIAVGTNIGLSEYTNANFFSEDIINNSNFPYPQISQQTPIAERTITNSFWNTTYPRQYYLKNCCGETNGGQGYLLAAVDYLDYYRNQYPLLSFALPKIPVLDDNVYGDYASLLLPRAVGYSAGLLNYFFRGSIEITLPSGGIYSLADNGFSKITLLAKNISGNGNDMPMPGGSIKLVARYRTVQGDPFQPLDLQASNDFTYSVVPETSGRTTIPRDAPVELIFDNGQNTIIPADAVDVSLQVVYNGVLGSENEAIAVGFKSVSDPTPVELVSNMDNICLNGTWYTAGSAEAIAVVDTNGDGIPGWDIYPHILQEAYVRISPSGNPVTASPTVYTFNTSGIQPGMLHRVYILSDYMNQINHSHYVTVNKTTESDTFTHVSDIFTGIWTADMIKSQIEYSNDQAVCNQYGFNKPCTIRHAPLFYSFRGNYIWGPTGTIFDNPKYPVDTNCTWDLLP